MATAPALFGQKQKFQPGAEPITPYLEHFTAYLDTHEIADTKRASMLVSTIGQKTYAVLRSLMAPDTPQSKSYDVLVQALKKHHEPKPLIIAERCIFHQRHQAPGESIAEYVVELRRLASMCKFVDDALRDQLVCELRSASAP